MLLNAVPIFSQILALTFDLQLVCTARLFFLKRVGKQIPEAEEPKSPRKWMQDESLAWS